MKGSRFRGAFRGRLTKSNIVITEIIDVDPVELKREVEDFSDLNQLRSFKSENAFKRYKRAKKIKKAL